MVSDFGQPFLTRHEDIDFHIYHRHTAALRETSFRVPQAARGPHPNFDRHDLDLLWQVPRVTAYLALPGIFFPRFWRALSPVPSAALATTPCPPK